jgi:hypothetical protein
VQECQGVTKWDNVREYFNKFWAADIKFDEFKFPNQKKDL